MSTEDTTAQLREQIAESELVAMEKSLFGRQAGAQILIREVRRLTSAVEAAKATARREALTAVLAVPYCRDVGHTEAIHSATGCCDPYETPCAAFTAGMASAQGVAPAEHVYGCPNFGIQRSGGQGAQSGGHEYDPGSGGLRAAFGQGPACRAILRGAICMRPADHPAHVQRDPGQPGEQGPADD